MAGSRLQVLKQIAKALAAQFGNDCEVVIHDLARNSIDNSVVYIENGHISGREIGSGPSRVVLDTIQQHPTDPPDHLAYLTRTESGHILKSSTIFVKDDEGEIRYIFGINYDITNLLALETSIHHLTSNARDEEEATKNASPITHDVNTLLDELIEQSVALVGHPVPLMSKEDKVKAIQFLNDAGAFLITKSGDKVAKYFGISKYTLYSYVDINK